MAEGERYTVQVVTRLLGIREGRLRSAHRQITFLDLLSWVRDPGGDHVWYAIAVAHEDPYVAREAWMARRGPGNLDSPVAVVVWDVLRAMNHLRGELDTQGRAIVALALMGFTEKEMAEVLEFRSVDPDTGKPKELPHAVLEARRKRVERILAGRMKRDPAGRPVRDDAGDVERIGGMVPRLTRAMNNGGAAAADTNRADTNGPRPDELWQ